MRVREMELVKRMFDHSARNEQFELLMKIRGSEKQLNEVVKLIIEKTTGELV